MYDIKTQKIKTFHEKVEKIFEISWKTLNFILFYFFIFLQGKQIMQNTNKRTDTRRTLGELGDYEDRANLLSPKNSENLTVPNLSPLKNSEKSHSPNLWSENSGEKVLILTI